MRRDIAVCQLFRLTQTQVFFVAGPFGLRFDPEPGLAPPQVNLFIFSNKSQLL